MKAKICSFPAMNGRITIGAIILASPAFANESDFTFTMENRYVNGESNKVIHTMDRGTLTVSGELWASHCDEEAVPELVRFEVMEEEALGDFIRCRFSVLPLPDIGEKVSFDITCDKFSKTTFYIVAYQVADDDGCTIQAKGKLKAK